jgi:hypothetical protein
MHFQHPAPHGVDPALLDRVATSIGSSLRPVRPLPPAWVLAGGLVLVCAAVALAGAARSGFYGIQKLSVLERALIFPTLGVIVNARLVINFAERYQFLKLRSPQIHVGEHQYKRKPTRCQPTTVFDFNDEDFSPARLEL